TGRSRRRSRPAPRSSVRSPTSSMATAWGRSSIRSATPGRLARTRRTCRWRKCSGAWRSWANRTAPDETAKSGQRPTPLGRIGMYTLYGKKGAGSAAVETALALAHAPYRMIETASWEQNDDFAGLLERNPLGQIPTLVLDDGSAMSESAAILIHLGLVHPESGLLPIDVAARAQVVRGLVFIAANCYAAISIIDFPERWCENADGDEAV